MARFFLLLWVTGLFTLVPFWVYTLFFVAERQDYAFYIVMPLFWIFGYWGVAGPLIAAWRVYSLMQAFEKIQSREELEALLRNPETEEAAVDLVAMENKLPRFLARKLVRRIARELENREKSKEHKNQTDRNTPD